MNNDTRKVASVATVSVCLVEDNALDVRLISDMLLKAGRGQFVLHGVYRQIGDAIRLLQDGQHGIELVLLDLSLPDSYGIDTFRRLSQAVPDLPLIVLSGYDDEALAIQTVHEGAQDYLVKNDLTGRLLIRAITYAMERKRAQLELQAARNELEMRVKERTQELQSINQQLAEALQQLNTTQVRMIQQERLHALERMASGIAHDFNNALSPILAHTEWLLMKPEAMRDEEKLSQTLVKIHDSATHCAEVVGRLREFYRSRDELGHFTPVDLQVVLEDAISLTQPCWKDQAQGRGASIRVEPNFAEVPKILGIKAEVREMLTNLMLNAIDAIKDNGVIRVSVFEEGERICVRISDNGVGMTEEVGARCMEPFFTTKHGQGSGLGLGVVYGIAQRHDAEINIESQVGSGTDVTVRFPPYSAQRESDAAVLQPANGLRILVAEDEPMIREVLGIYLGEDAHKTEMAADGGEALRKLEGGQFDLVITDNCMPEVSGDRVAKTAHTRNKDIRVLMLTGFGDMMTQDPDGRKYVDALISKPFTFDSLRRGIAKAMAVKRQ